MCLEAPLVKLRVNISLHIMSSSTKAIVFILLPLLMTYVVTGDDDADAVAVAPPAPTAGGSFPFVVKTLKKLCARLNYCNHEHCRDVCAYVGYRSHRATCEIDEGQHFCCCG
jgi:hypothetical protein